MQIRGPLRRDGHGVLEMGRQAAVLAVDGPAVGAHPDAPIAHIHHRLDGEDHALLEQVAGARAPVVRDLGVLVHLAAHPVPHQGADHREAVLLDPLLDGGGDVAQAVAGPALLDAVEERGLGGVEQARGHRRHRADRDRDGGVGHPAVEHHAHVHRQDVAALELVDAGDAVDHHRVGRRADRAREAAVALEGGLGALGADVLLGRLVELAPWSPPGAPCP